MHASLWTFQFNTQNIHNFMSISRTQYHEAKNIDISLTTQFVHSNKAFDPVVVVYNRYGHSFWCPLERREFVKIVIYLREARVSHITNRCRYNTVKYDTAGTEAEDKSETRNINHNFNSQLIPHSFYSEYFEENWFCYNGIAVYFLLDLWIGMC